MTISELNVGMWVTDGAKGIPMYVQDIHHDGTVYLNFPGNQALDWECDVKDLRPIPICEGHLAKMGMKLESESPGIFILFSNRRLIDPIKIIYWEGSRSYEVKIYKFRRCVKTAAELHYIHELQHEIGDRLTVKL